MHSDCPSASSIIADLQIRDRLNNRRHMVTMSVIVHTAVLWSVSVCADRRHRKRRQPRTAKDHRPGRQTESAPGRQDLAENVSADVYALQHRLLADVHTATGRAGLSRNTAIRTVWCNTGQLHAD